MPRQVVLLRGINLGASNRVAMPALRDALTPRGSSATARNRLTATTLLELVTDD